MGFWSKFKKGLFTRSQVLTGVSLSLLTTSAIVFAFNQLSLNIFSSGTTISSTQVNDNFEYINERIKYLAGQQFEVARTADFPLTSGLTSRTLFLDAAIADFTSNSLANSVATQGYFTVPETGLYELQLSGELSPANAFAYQSLMVYIEYVDSIGSTYTSNLWSAGIEMNSTRLIHTKHSTYNLQAGDILFLTPNFEQDDHVIKNVKFKIKKL